MRLTNATTPGLADHDVLVVQGGVAYLNDIERRLAPYCARAEPRQRAMAYLRGLLSPAERKNSWQVAEVSGDTTPDAFQHRRRRALGDPEAVRDATGVLKQGRHSAGVARQYRGTAGRIEHGPIGALLGYASRPGYALVDRERYLPEAWTTDRARGHPAGIPDARRFATTPQLATELLVRAVTGGMRATWVTGDSVYGADRRVRMWLESPPQAEVLAVSGKADGGLGEQPQQVNTILAAWPAEGWPRLSAGDGAQGPRWYDWRWRPVAAPAESDGRRWLLVRRRVNEPTELRASMVFAPEATTVAEVVRVAGTRWVLAQLFDAAKGEVGLDHDEVRRWTGWDRQITLALWALALLTVLRAGALALAAVQKRLAPVEDRSRLAAFKANRGLPSCEASQNFGGSCGVWCWRSSNPPSTSSLGPPGTAGTRAWPSTITPSVVGH
jgi:SRSO17 transposase